MRTIYSVILLVFCGLTACSKEVSVDIPKFSPRMVVDGFIETGMPPVVILSTSQDLFSVAGVAEFLNGFIADAKVWVSDGVNDYPLSVICSADLPLSIQQQIKGLLGLESDSTNSFNICAYTSLNPSVWGQPGKQYTLKIQHAGQTYTATTSIVPTMNPEHIKIWWKEEKNNTGFGFSYATFHDPIYQYDAYKWEVKRIKTINDSTVVDNYFRLPFGAIFDDNFFNGKVFTTYYGNPWTWNSNYPQNERGRFQQGDTVVIKISKMDKPTYDFLSSKYGQTFSLGNPFASYMNVKTNVSGDALGVWAGYSPYFDTLICIPTE